MIQPSTSGRWTAIDLIARMNVFTSLMGTTRPRNPITGGGRGGRFERSAAKWSTSTPFGMTRVRSGSAPSSIWRLRLPSYSAMTDWAEAYARECRQLVASLGLSDNVRFLGFQRPEEILPRLGLLVLTSISEALPLVVLEAFASGLPVLTTDVGACRELIEGRTAPDRALGSAGAVVPIANPQATAAAALELLRDEARWSSAQRAAVERAQAHYRQDQMIEAYRHIYAEASAWPA